MGFVRADANDVSYEMRSRHWARPSTSGGHLSGARRVTIFRGWAVASDGAHVGRSEAIKLPLTSTALAITMFDASNAAPLADALIPSVRTGTAEWKELISRGVGQLTRPYGTAPIDPMLAAHSLARVQEAIRTAGRFGIPALVGLPRFSGQFD